VVVLVVGVRRVRMLVDEHRVPVNVRVRTAPLLAA
jgi:hypothetical protein